MSAIRRSLDRYYTPEHAVGELIKYVDWFDRRTLSSVFECCVGTGNIVSALHKFCGLFPTVTNDIDRNVKADAHLDASQDRVWEFLDKSQTGSPDYTISNPPFLYAPEIVERALKHSQLGVAMLLRLSFLEGCYDRRWLVQKPPTNLLVLPRISFTDDGKSDMVTCAWFIWNFTSNITPAIKIISKFV